MSASDRTKRIVWAKARGLCSFPDCGKDLVVDETQLEGTTLLGEVAHIVSDSPDKGPRYEFDPPGGDRDGEPNLILLCTDHHTLIDAKPKTYTVERLVGIKSQHEQTVRKRLGRSRYSPVARRTEFLHSTLLSVNTLPTRIYMAECTVKPEQILERIRYPVDKSILVSHIVRSGKLITFNDITERGNPFSDVITPDVEPHAVADWLKDDDLSRWIIALLNMTFGKYTRALGLRWDKEHRRYYFPPIIDDDGTVRAREVSYRPLNRTASTRSAVWNPTTRKTGEPKKFWVHLAAAFSFHRVSPGHWVFAIRPEQRFTKNGIEPISSKTTGKKSTTRKSHMYNIDLLEEIQFWKSYLTKDTPRILMNLGKQSVIVDGEFLSAEVTWPDVTTDTVSFRNLIEEDDLFTSAAYWRAIEEGRVIELDDLELEDLQAIEDESVDFDAVVDEED